MVEGNESPEMRRMFQLCSTRGGLMSGRRTNTAPWELGISLGTRS